MKILWYIHGYPPTHNAGAEWMAYDITEHLKQRNDVTVLCRNAQNGYQDGVNVLNYDITTAKSIIKEHDVVFTHLDFTGKAFNSCRVMGKHNLFVVVHNTNENAILRRRTWQANVIYNSNYTASMNYPQRSMILRPPIVPERYRKPKTGEGAITLVNCWPDKGGDVLVKLAKLMPDRKFIGVLGGYGEQIQGRLPNLEYVKNGVNMADIYARTAILIQPSKYESYGKAACEGLATDTPVICTATPGLIEALDYAGIYAERDAEAYKEAIENIDMEYQIGLCRQRTAELVEQTKQDLDTLTEFIKQ